MRRLLPLLLAGCASPSPEDVVEHVWADFDARYATFEVRGVDWDTARDEALADLAASDRSDAALEEVLHGMLGRLDDDHVRLLIPDQTQQLWSAGALNGRLMDDFDPEVTDALVGDVTTTRDAAWGTLAGGRLAYLRLSRLNPGAEAQGSAFLADPGEVEGLVLDLRGNGGGFPWHGEHVVAHLFDQDVVYARHRARTPDGGFTDWTDADVDALGTHPDLPVAVLHHAFTVSGAEQTVLMLRQRGPVRVTRVSGGLAWSPDPNRVQPPRLSAAQSCALPRRCPQPGS